MSFVFKESDVASMAGLSPLAQVKWAQRGRAPVGYIRGLAVMYARIHQHLREKDPAAIEMAKEIGHPSVDALAYYQFLNGVDPVSNLQSLFILMTGLGMRESSGDYGMGRDRSANNTTADTAEAGMFQMSWDIAPSSHFFPELMKAYRNANVLYGLEYMFREGVRVNASTANYGEGTGAAYQKLAKTMPAFAVECAAIGLRNHRKHWGPINRHEAEVRPEAARLYSQIGHLVDQEMRKEPEPTPAPPKPAVSWWHRMLFGG